MIRPEIEKTMLAAKLDPPKEIIDVLSIVKKGSSVLDLNGGVGLVAEYLSKKFDCDVTLTCADRLAFSYRRTIVPQSKVKNWNIESGQIKLDKPSFDYVVCRYTGDFSLAMKLAKVKVLLLLDKESIDKLVEQGVITSVVNIESDPTQDTKTSPST